MQRRTFIITSILSIAVIIFILIFVLNRDNNTYKIKKEMQGVRISKDTLEVIEDVSIVINGRMNIDDNGFTFMGKMNISSLEYSNVDDSVMHYYIGNFEDGQKEKGLISYVRNIKKDGVYIPDVASINWVNTDSKFSYLILSNYDDDCIYNSSDNTLLTYQGNDILIFPATDAEAALKLMEEHQINQQIFKKTSLD